MKPTIEVICAGLPAEMGRAQGEALATKMHQATATLRQIEAFRTRRPWWLPYPMYRRLAGRKAHNLLMRPLTQERPELAQRLAGLAEGAGMSLGNVYLLNSLEPLLCSIAGSTACPGACSAVAVRGPRSADGAPMLARNFDYLPAVQPLYVVRESQPSEGFRALEFTGAPLAGAIDGVNEQGLCINYDYAFTTDSAAGPAAPISALISEALRRFGTVEQAAAWIGHQRRWGGGLLMLADAGGDIASLELSNTRGYLRRPASGEDVLFHTNDFTGRHMREVQIPDDAVYAGSAPRPLRGRRVHLSSETRNRRYRQLLAQNPVIDPERLTAIMADHGSDGVPGDFTPCVHGCYWYTTATLQFFPKERRMRVSYSTACQARFAELAL